MRTRKDEGEVFTPQWRVCATPTWPLQLEHCSIEMDSNKTTPSQTTTEGKLGRSAKKSSSRSAVHPESSATKDNRWILKNDGRNTLHQLLTWSSFLNRAHQRAEPSCYLPGMEARFKDQAMGDDQRDETVLQTVLGCFASGDSGTSFRTMCIL